MDSTVSAFLVSELVANILRTGTLIAAILLIIVSSMMVGRVLADLEYQLATDINGIRRIESRVNRRTHVNRIVLGIAYVLTTILVLLEINPPTLLWVNRLVAILVLLSFTGTSVLDWFDARKQMEYLVQEQARDRHRISARGHGFPERSGTTGEYLPTAQSEPVDAGDGGAVAP
jgi:flagellar biosynthesis protein FliQ